MVQALTQADVARLIDDRSPASRLVTAEKLADQYANGALSDSERHIADDIIRLLARDVELKVRARLAELVKESDRLPHDVATTLAADLDPVAMPILKFSPVLTDADLIDVINRSGDNKQIAIAGRNIVTDTVCDALVDTGRENVVSALLDNAGARISDCALQTILHDHGGSEAIKDAIVHRKRLPVTITEQLIMMVSDQLQSYLIVNHDLPDQLASDLILEARQRTTADLVAGNLSDDDIDPLVHQLNDNGRLTPSLIFRALCLGDITFFASALACRAQIPTQSTLKLIHIGGQDGISALLHQSDIPPAMRGVVNMALMEARDMSFTGQPDLRGAYFRRVLEKILHSDEYIEPDDLAYLQHHMAELTIAGH